MNGRIKFVFNYSNSNGKSGKKIEQTKCRKSCKKTPNCTGENDQMTIQV